MYLFGKKDTFLVVGGIIFCHLLVGALCILFAYKFLIATYDAGVFLLLSLLIGPLIICDILATKVQAFRRFFVRCRVNSKGIRCTCLSKKWNIKWCDICVFGITGFSSMTQTGIVFLSSDFFEKYQEKTLTNITNNRIVFSVNEHRWKFFSKYMPDDMKRKLEKAICNSHDCYYRY